MIDLVHELGNGGEESVFPFSSDNYEQGKYCIKLFKPKFKQNLYRTKALLNIAKRYGLTCFAECGDIVQVNVNGFHNEAIVMRKYEGDLNQYMRFIHYNQYQIRFSTKVEIGVIIGKMIKCFRELHSIGYIWGDVKLDNFLIDTRTCDVVIADFACAQPANSPLKIKTDTYLPPEYEFIGIGTNQLDCFELGFAIFILIYGRYPFPYIEVGNQVIIAEYKLTIPDWRSYQCELLIRGLLNLDPNTRLTQSQIYVE